MDGWVMDGWIHRWIGGWRDGQMKGCMDDGWIDQWMVDGWLDGGRREENTDRRMDGWGNQR